MTHCEATDEARRHFEEGLRSLELAVGLLRGPLIRPSPEMMRAEAALSRAIDALRASGLRSQGDG